MMVCTRTVWLVFVLLVAGCAGRPPALLTPIAETPDGAAQVDVLAISTRALSDLEGEIYSGERGQGVSAHVVNVAIPPSHELGAVEWPSSKYTKSA